jgi:hypothetical protein
MRNLRASLVFVAALFASYSAKADVLAIVIDERGLPSDLSPANYYNSPDNYDNSSANYANAVANYENSPANYDNSPANYDNSASGGKRRLVTQDGKIIGYYVPSKSGVLNFYNKSGRVAYMPAGGRTSSLFSSESSAWCGTFGTSNGKTAIGLTKACLLRFLID